MAFPIDYLEGDEEYNFMGNYAFPATKNLAKYIGTEPIDGIHPGDICEYRPQWEQWIRVNDKVVVHHDFFTKHFSAIKKPVEFSDREFLELIHDRLINVHGEPANIDFMIKLKEIINKI